MSCLGCAGTRATPDDFTGDYQSCSTCVIETSTTFFALDDPNLAVEDR